MSANGRSLDWVAIDSLTPWHKAVGAHSVASIGRLGYVSILCTYALSIGLTLSRSGTYSSSPFSSRGFTEYWTYPRGFLSDHSLSSFARHSACSRVAKRATSRSLKNTTPTTL